MCRDQWSSEPFVWQLLNEDFKLVPWVVEHFAWGPLSTNRHTLTDTGTHIPQKPLFPSPPQVPLLRLPLPTRLCNYISLMALSTWYSSLSDTVLLLSHCEQDSCHTVILSIKKTIVMQWNNLVWLIITNSHVILIKNLSLQITFINLAQRVRKFVFGWLFFVINLILLKSQFISS